MKTPSGSRHARCELHVPHPYPSSGWLCMDDPSRADAMRAFADLIAEVAARHHAAETERAGVPTDGALVPHSFSYPRLDTSSQCVGHQCRALELIVPQPVRGPRVKVRKPSPAVRSEAITAAIPAPALAVVQPATRPTCERCGQSFRLSGIGYAWHVKNRPNCAGPQSAITS